MPAMLPPRSWSAESAFVLSIMSRRTWAGSARIHSSTNPRSSSKVVADTGVLRKRSWPFDRSKKRSACWEGMNGMSFTRSVSREAGRGNAKFISYGLSRRVDRNDLRGVGGLYELMKAISSMRRSDTWYI